MIITPFNELQNFSPAPLTQGGVWTFVSGPVGNPPAPGTWDGTIDFTGATVGTYVYEYTVGTCNVAAQLTIEATATIARPNDICANATNLLFSGANEFTGLLNQSTAAACPFAAASNEGISEPWAGGPYNDLWYSANLTLPNSGLQITVTVDGQPYGTEGIFEPKLAFYDQCGLVALASAESVATGRFVSLTYTLTTDTPLFIIRVAGATDGRFDIEISA